jgi:uncharacterized protein with NRDE domain
MCLIAWALGMRADCPLLIASNRDEYWDRPTLPLERWLPSGVQPVYSGRDVRAGGTWMGFNAHGRVAMLTNVQQAEAAHAPRSRGELPMRWLDAKGRTATWETLVDAFNPADFSGFNLVLGDQSTSEWIWLSNRPADPQPAQTLIPLPPGWTGHHLSPGIYGLSNASLDTPWPKTRFLKNAVAEAMASDPMSRERVERLLLTLQTFSDPGDDPVTSLQNHPFVHRPQARYGTRSSLIARQLKTPQGYSLELQEWTYAPARLAEPVNHTVCSISTWAMPTSR